MGCDSAEANSQAVDLRFHGLDLCLGAGSTLSEGTSQSTQDPGPSREKILFCTRDRDTLERGHTH